jgi:outer membrane protein TolC
VTDDDAGAREARDGDAALRIEDPGELEALARFVVLCRDILVFGWRTAFGGLMSSIMARITALVLASCAACIDQRSVREERDAAISLPERERAAATRALRARDDEVAVPTTMTLADAIRIATTRNREYEFQRETVYLDSLSLEVTRHGLSDPIFAAQLQYVFAGTRHGPYSNTGTASASVTQILPTGATVQGSGFASTSQASSGQPSPTSTVGAQASISQPLLRGIAPYVFEPLTQAERDQVYALRDFELFRQSFAIELITRYYGLVSEKQRVANVRRSVDNFEFDARKARALFAVDRTNKIDMLRAEQAFLSAKNGLIDEEQAYRLALDRFKVFLGIPTSSEFGIPDDAEPAFVPVTVELDAAVTTALEKRLDLLTAHERVEDSERQVSTAKNALLPSLTANGAYQIQSDSPPGSRGNELGFRNDAYQAGFTLEIPLERTNERRNLRAALVGLDRARRALDLAEETVIVNVRDDLRRLRSQEDQIKIQRAIIETESARVKFSEIRYQAGEIESRDLTEARQNLLSAENSLIDTVVAYEVSRLNLLREMGTLVVDEEGTIR